MIKINKNFFKKLSSSYSKKIKNYKATSAIKNSRNSIFPKNLLSKILLFFLIFSSLTTSALAKNVTDTHASTVENSFSLRHDITTKVANKIGIKKLNQENKNSINEFIQIVAYFESKLNKNAYNKYSGANSYFQFLNSSFRESRDVARKYFDNSFPFDSSVRGYSYQGQSQLAMILWYNHSKWTSKRTYKKELTGLFNRDYASGIKVYCSYHHTDCGRQLSSTRYRALRTALRNWSKNTYYTGSGKRKSHREVTRNFTNTADSNKKIISKNMNSFVSSIEGKTKDEKIVIIKKMILELNKLILKIQVQDIRNNENLKNNISNKKIVKVEKKQIKKETQPEIKIKNIYCKPLLDDYISLRNYKRYDVIDLENFLNKYENENLKVNGKFELADINAVKRFQLKYKKDILDPWNETTATGYVFKTTKNKINSLYCNYKSAGKGMKIH